MVRLTLLLALVAAAAAKPAAVDQTYAHLRIIAPAAPGGGWDQTARVMQQVLQTSGIVETASVENIPGAAGTIGLARLIGAERGKGDVAMVSGLIMLGAIASHRSPVTLRDVTPIARLTGEYEVIVVPAASPYRTLTELLDAFRARPESIAWAGGSAGGTDQILAGLVADAVGVSPRRVNYVAFAGGGESMAAILGGQVTAGISGLGEFAPQIATGALRVLAISSDVRRPDVPAPTLREQGVDVVLENWRSLVGPPDMSVEDRDRLQRAVAAMVTSTAWHEALRRYGWSDRYLAGAAFARFLADEDARVVAILDKLGAVTAPAGGAASVGFYPIFVIAGFALCVIGLTLRAVGARRDVDTSSRNRADAGAPRAQDRRSQLRAISPIALGITLNVLMIERAGFVLASIPLFWLTARVFDAKHPLRDVIVAVALSLGTHFLFARLLQVALPAGVLAPWL
jgi:putative tricarboxylic transport membrane protein